MNPALVVEGLTIRLPAGGDRPFAVEDVSFTVGTEEVVCLVGESGSGKSMIAHAVLSLLPRGVALSAGSVTVAGRDVARLGRSDLRALRGRDAAMIFQEPLSSLNPLKPVGEQIGEAIGSHAQPRLGGRATRARVLDLIGRVGLPDPARIARSYPFELSGGQRQRVMIASAIANGPGLLVADEPTTALDVTTQRQILALIDGLRRERRMGILLITHDFGVVADVADRVVVLRGGRVVEQGPAAALLHDPQEPYTRRLIDAVPRGRTGAGRPAPTGRPILRVENLTKTFAIRTGLFSPARSVTAAAGISLDLHRGETVAVVGESGSGKSTLARMMVRLMEPDGGAVKLGDTDLLALRGEALRQARRRIQIVFQDPFASLDPRQAVGDAVARGPMAFGTPRAVALAEAGALLARVGVGPAAATRYPHEFSGGQRQRICIARALALKPDILIADEAVSALDVSVQAQVLDLLAELRDEMHLAMIFITHDLRIAAAIADRVVVLRHGRVVEQGPTAALFAAPVASYTRELLAAVPGQAYLGTVQGADLAEATTGRGQRP